MSLVLAYVRPDEVLLACDTFGEEGGHLMTEPLCKLGRKGHFIFGRVGLIGVSELYLSLWEDCEEFFSAPEHLLHMHKLREFIREHGAYGKDDVPDIEMLIAGPGDCIQMINSGYISSIQRWQAIGATPGVVLAHYCFRQTSKILEREEVLELFDHIFRIAETTCDSVRRPWIWMSTKDGFILPSELEGSEYVRD